MHEAVGKVLQRITTGCGGVREERAVKTRRSGRAEVNSFTTLSWQHQSVAQPYILV